MPLAQPGSAAPAARRRGPARDRGAITAEFVVAVPALLAVLALAIGAVLLATHRVRVTAAAAEIARLEARGDVAAAAQVRAGLGARASVTAESDGALRCVWVIDRPARGLLGALPVEARACAARSDAGVAP